MTDSGRVEVYALESEGSGRPLARGSLIAPSVALLEPSLDDLAELGSGLGNGELRVRVHIEGDADFLEGAVLFSDPFDEGLLAIVDLDRPSAAKFVPLSDVGVIDERSAVDSAYARIAGPGAPGDEPGEDDARDWDSHRAGRGLDLARPITIPVDPPPRWPPNRPWPPGHDADSMRVLCWILPCCRGCPRNDRCVGPRPPHDPYDPVDRLTS